MSVIRNSPLHLLLPAIPVAASTARLHLRHWLERERWPEQPSEDITYSMNEAVTNAIEHAYPPGIDDATVTVTAQVEQLPPGMRRVRVQINDHGRWRRALEALDGRGHGLMLMHGLMDQVQINHRDSVAAGTEVVLLSRPVPTVT